MDTEPENMTDQFTPLNDLAMIGDRRALLDKRGNIVWYCPKRFDSSSLLLHCWILKKAGTGAWI
ncbi:hypothetical protein DXT99_22245 [Pontibacter diazotrophicus]|uniref:Uncharacterized protein n=2 Tax=Pontibacter diazotrophicus TaxID=1400979 RepID=A0A3D8L6P9_9BACT|nr:hypothetical protein DXT99_22245 [Pontibacter diazotrophicus]